MLNCRNGTRDRTDGRGRRSCFDTARCIAAVAVAAVAVIALFTQAANEIAAARQATGREALRRRTKRIGCTRVAFLARFHQAVPAQGTSLHHSFFGDAAGGAAVSVKTIAVVTLFAAVLHAVTAEGECAIVAAPVGKRGAVAESLIAFLASPLICYEISATRLRAIETTGIGACVAVALAVIAILSRLYDAVAAVRLARGDEYHLLR